MITSQIWIRCRGSADLVRQDDLLILLFEQGDEFDEDGDPHQKMVVRLPLTT